MTKEEAIKMIKAKLECMTRDVSGRDSDCINRRCDECSLNYEKGNMGEQKEWLRMAIKALEEQPSTQPKDECDCISRKGHWIEHKHGGIERIECSKCRCWFLRKDLIRNSYCPNCGSRNHWEWELKM